MKGKGVWLENRCLGSTTVGPRGQVVIPVNARKEMGIDAGITLLVFKALRGQGLVLLKVDAIEQIMGMVSQRLADFEKLVKDYKSPKAVSGKREG
ncbi:hypothetical protein ES708_12902 [subsurface metagenome]